MLTVDSLRAFGANVEEGLARCMGMEAMYLRLVKIAVGDQNFEKLHNSVDQGDLDAAFEAAHALKGMLGNLSLTPIYKPVEELTELLRFNTAGDYGTYVAEIENQRKQVAAMID